MATVNKINGKRGISYQLIVTNGKDQDGKKIRHSKTWTPPAGMSEAKADAEAKYKAREFEQSIKEGFIADNRQTFAEYAEYVVKLKAAEGLKDRSILSYREHLKRINPEIGHLKLQDIRPQHINNFYIKLKQSVTSEKEKAIAKDPAIVAAILKKYKLTQDRAAELAEIAASTLRAIGKGEKVSGESARKFCEAFDIEPKDAFIFEIEQQHLTGRTIQGYHRIIHAILSQAEKEMIVSYNAAAKATPPKAEKHEANYFTPEQIADILTAIEKEPIKWKTIIHLLIVTGCRRGEIAALKWSNIDFQNNKIIINASLLYHPKMGTYESETKTGDIRILKLPAETMKLLTEYRIYYNVLKLKNGDQWQGTKDYCFTQDNGLPLNPQSITAICDSLSKNNPNLPHINPHAFRHTAATTLLFNGIDVKTVSKRLGHSQTSTTLNIYAHALEAAEAEAADCIADVLLKRKAQ